MLKGILPSENEAVLGTESINLRTDSLYTYAQTQGCVSYCVICPLFFSNGLLCCSPVMPTSR